jgi:hypothetical protein
MTTKAPRVLRGKFASDMSHCPSKVNNATKALLRAPKSLITTTNYINHGLFETSNQQTIHYKKSSCPCNISLG